MAIDRSGQLPIYNTIGVRENHNHINPNFGQITGQEPAQHADVAALSVLSYAQFEKELHAKRALRINGREGVGYTIEGQLTA